MADFEEKLSAYMLAKAAQDQHYASDIEGTGKGYDERDSQLDDVRTDTLDALLLMPARNGWQLSTKMRIIIQEEAVTNYYLAQPILALLADDIRRVTMGVRA